MLINVLPNIVGNKALDFIKLENLGFNIPEFMYYNAEFVIENDHKYLYYDEYYKKYLKNNKIIIRHSINKEYKESIFFHEVIDDKFNLHNKMSNHIKNYKKEDFFINEKENFGLILQKYLNPEFSAIVNINYDDIIISYGKGSVQDVNLSIDTFNSFSSIIDLKISLDKKVSESLITVIKELQTNFHNCFVELSYSEKYWYIINIKHNLNKT